MKLQKNKETEKKIDELLAKMTLEEKVGQLNQDGSSPMEGKGESADDNIRAGRVGTLLGVHGTSRCNHLQKVAVEESRLGIPLLFGMDVIHGHRTIFPIPLAESCSWDEELFEKTAQVSALEAAVAGINWVFAPMLDVSRDGRWGRITEGAGEDPYLVSRYAAAKVHGLQGEDLTDPTRVLACAKHFVAYGAAIGGRDYNSTDISLQTLWEVYLPPFIAACESGAATYMAAFQDLNGIPCTVNSYLLQDVLREKLGFEGLVISDWEAIGECVNHGIALDRKDAAKQALIAGVAIDMLSKCYMEYVPDMVRRGEIPEERLDEAVRQVLRVKFAKGLFDHPYVDPELEEKVTLCPEHRAVAREAARKSMVLLKNNGILPLQRGIKIAVVGELADRGKDMMGTWVLHGKAEETVTLTEALERQNVDYHYVPCCGVEMPLDKQALNAAIAEADVVLAAVGGPEDLSGEATSLSNLDLTGDQNEMLRLIRESNKPLVTILINGRPLAVGDAVACSDAVLEAWHAGSETGNGIADILFGDYNPSGRLTVTFPNSAGEYPAYYNHMPTGRPASTVFHTSKYQDAPLKPLYPFGYGLSYTTYLYHDLKVTAVEDMLEATVEVENSGSMDGEETVQLYVRDVAASRVRPVRELKGFRKVFLKSGERKNVTIQVPVSSLGYYDNNMNYVVEKGEFRIYVGHDSETELCESFWV